MALPWLLGAAAAAVIGAVIASSDDDSNKGSGGNNDDDNEEQRRRAERKAEKEREKAERKAMKQNLSRQFDERCRDAQIQITQGLEPYFSVVFRGYTGIKSEMKPVERENFFGSSLKEPAMLPLVKTVENLNYIKQQYDVEITPGIELHYAWQEIDDCEVQVKELKALQQAIQQTIEESK